MCKTCVYVSILLLNMKYKNILPVIHKQEHLSVTVSGPVLLSVEITATGPDAQESGPAWLRLQNPSCMRAGVTLLQMIVY
jgi:hypothetical protein